MAKKAKAAGSNCQGKPEHEPGLCVSRKPHPTECSTERHTACIAIDSIHEIIGIRQTYDPKECDEDADHTKLHITEHGNRDHLEISHTPNRCYGDQPLNDEAEARG